jgi:hypothetical protein
MPDRELSFSELRRIFEGHGCRFTFANGYIKVSRGSGPDYKHWTQHAHKGPKDRFGPYVVKLGRRGLGFAGMSDQEFYKPIG